MLKGGVDKEENELGFGTATLESPVSYLSRWITSGELQRGVNWREFKGW